MTVRVTTGGAERMRAKTARRLTALTKEKLGPVLNASGKELVAEYRAKINTFIPGSVPDLKPATKLHKQKQVGFVYPILVRTGQMLASMYHRVVYSSVATIRIGFKGRRDSGTPNSIVGTAHLDGTPTLPKRDFTSITDSWRKRLLARIRRSLK